MRAIAAVAALLAACTAIAVPGALAAARLAVPAAAERSDTFARRTCARDQHCIGYGVLNCRRQGPRTVLCRIFDERRTPVQGKYRCDRLIRVTLRPPHRLPITGLGRWHC